jgi:hypothetical protein
LRKIIPIDVYGLKSDCAAYTKFLDGNDEIGLCLEAGEQAAAMMVKRGGEWGGEGGAYLESEVQVVIELRFV